MVDGRRSTRWRPAGCTTWSAAASTATRSTREWLVPHFEKMLYDNALLAAAYLHAWVVTGEERYREVAEGTLDYVLRELALAGGRARLGAGRGHRRRRGPHLHAGPRRSSPSARHGAATSCSSRSSTAARSSAASSPEEERARLLAVRASAGRSPLRDDKAIAAWNGLALAALAEAGRRLDREDYVDAARGVAEFLLGPLSEPAAGCCRSRREGRTSGAGYLEDYADVAHGLLELHVATGEARWLARGGPAGAARGRAVRRRGARRLLPLAGTTPSRSFARAKDLQDHPTPSGNSMLAYVLLRFAPALGRRRARAARRRRPAARPRPARACAERVRLGALRARPLPCAAARDRDLGAPQDEVARAALAAWRAERGRRLRRRPSGRAAAGGQGRVDGRPAVYVCERFACRAPVTDPAELTTQSGGA